MYTLIFPSIADDQCCGSGSVCFLLDPEVRDTETGSLYQQANMVRKNLIPTVLSLSYDFLSLKNYVNVPSKSNGQKNFFLNTVVFLLAH
jgi:hypothetical protein